MNDHNNSIEKNIAKIIAELRDICFLEIDSYTKKYTGRSLVERRTLSGSIASVIPTVNRNTISKYIDILKARHIISPNPTSEFVIVNEHSETKRSYKVYMPTNYKTRYYVNTDLISSMLGTHPSVTNSSSVHYEPSAKSQSGSQPSTL